MRQLFEGKTFFHFQDRESRRVFEGIEFRNCIFQSCIISVCEHPIDRSVIRDVKIVKCEAAGCGLYSAIIEDVFVENLRTALLHNIWGAVFNRVTLSGRMGRIVFNDLVDPGRPDSRMQTLFHAANADYYSSVDWALDISRAEFADCDIRGIPAQLVRRDPDTQVIVTREKALEGRWKNLDLEGTHWPTSIQFMLERGDPDVVLIAPKRSRVFKQLVAGLQLLRQAGVAEPD